MQPATTANDTLQRPRLPTPTRTTRLKIQADVIRALMIRYIVAKYGRDSLGFYD